MSRKHGLCVALLLLVLLAGCASSPPSLRFAPVLTAPPLPSTLPHFAHIFVLVMENKESGSVIGNQDAPYINSLAQRYGMAASYYGMTHPSLPNYLELLGGSTFGVTSDCTDCFVNSFNLVDQLEEARKSWKAYMEGMPSPCFVGNAGSYAQKHNPFIYFDDIRQNPARCANIVPLSSFAADLAGNALPDFVWITPDLCHDMHDCAAPTGDDWLKGFLPQLFNAAAWESSALFLLWDEGATDDGCCQLAHGGHIPMLVISPLGKPGFVSSVEYDHASTLLTIEAAWGLGRLGDAACTCTRALTDFF
jgi:phospholipase C